MRQSWKAYKLSLEEHGGGRLYQEANDWQQTAVFPLDLGFIQLTQREFYQETGQVGLLVFEKRSYEQSCKLTLGKEMAPVEAANVYWATSVYQGAFNLMETENGHSNHHWCLAELHKNRSVLKERLSVRLRRRNLSKTNNNLCCCDWLEAVGERGAQSSPTVVIIDSSFKVRFNRGEYEVL